MKILLDHCIPRPFCWLLPGHVVVHASRRGWGHLSNGKLISAAIGEGFDVVVTVARSIPHQQNVSALPLANIVLKAASNAVSALARYAGLLMVVLVTVEPGAVIVLEMPA